MFILVDTVDACIKPIRLTVVGQAVTKAAFRFSLHCSFIVLQSGAGFSPAARM